MEQTELKNRLESELKDIEKTLSEHGHVSGHALEWGGSSDDLAVDSSDRNEVADQINELVNNIPIVEELKGRLHAIQKALSKMDAGTYGTCEVGGEPIPVERLEVNPAATTCIEHSK